MDLFIKFRIKQKLKKLNISFSNIELIQNKDGVIVARVQTDEKSYIIKYFQNEDFKREIENYKLLQSLNVPTISVIGFTNSAILMEDASQSDIFRLATKADLDDVMIASKIAEWYNLLHVSSKSFTEENSTKLYDETDFITRENIEFIKEKTGTQNLPVWKLIDDNFDVIIAKIKNLPRVLTYNDFYYTNLIIAKDKSSALMFDYNLLGKGYVYSDIRNVCYSLGENAKNAFLETYGGFDENEIIVDDVASVLITLYHACQRKNFPTWADYALEELKTDYENKVQMLINQ